MKHSTYKNKLIIVGIILVFAGLFFGVNPQQLTGSTMLKTNTKQLKINTNKAAPNSQQKGVVRCSGYWFPALEFTTEVSLDESVTSEIFSKINTYVKNGCDIKFNLIGRLDPTNQREIYDSVRSLTCENNVKSESQVGASVLCLKKDRSSFNGVSTLEFVLIEDKIFRFEEKATGFNEDIGVLSTRRQQIPTADQNARYIYQMFVR